MTIKLTMSIIIIKYLREQRYPQLQIHKQPVEPSSQEKTSKVHYFPHKGLMGSWFHLHSRFSPYKVDPPNPCSLMGHITLHKWWNNNKMNLQTTWVDTRFKIITIIVYNSNRYNNSIKLATKMRYLLPTPLPFWEPHSSQKRVQKAKRKVN